MEKTVQNQRHHYRKGATHDRIVKLQHRPTGHHSRGRVNGQINSKVSLQRNVTVLFCDFIFSLDVGCLDVKLL